MRNCKSTRPASALGLTMLTVLQVPRHRTALPDHPRNHQDLPELRQEGSERGKQHGSFTLHARAAKG